MRKATALAVVALLAFLACSVAGAAIEKGTKELGIAASAEKGDWGTSRFLSVRLGEFVTPLTEVLGKWQYQSAGEWSSNALLVGVIKHFEQREMSLPFVYGSVGRAWSEGRTANQWELGAGVLNMISEDWGIRYFYRFAESDGWKTQGFNAAIATFFHD